METSEVGRTTITTMLDARNFRPDVLEYQLIISLCTFSGINVMRHIVVDIERAMDIGHYISSALTLHLEHTGLTHVVNNDNGIIHVTLDAGSNTRVFEGAPSWSLSLVPFREK